MGDQNDVHSFDACYLPNGKIVFVSTAVRQGVPCSNGIAVAMNAWWTGPEMVYGITDSDPKVIIADQERIDRLLAHRDEIGERTLVGVRVADLPPGVTTWSELIVGTDPLPDVELDPTDAGAVSSSSRA